MLIREPSPADRIVFLDNLRLLTVLAVVALHAGVAYAPIVPWWYVADQSKNGLFDFLLIVTDGFVMPTLFFIAGYFALTSLRRQNASGFLRAKLRRLGLPLLVLTVFFSPIISYVVALGQGGSESYLHYWLRILPTTFRLDFHVLTPESVSTLHNYIWSFHLWFLALLLLFCGMLALWHAVAARRIPPVGPERRGPEFSLFAVLSLGLCLAEAGGQVAFPDTLWVSFGAFFDFQPARVPLYLGIFLLGVFTSDRQWFTAHRIPGRLWLWGLLGIVTYAAMLASGLANMAPGPKPVWIPLAHGLARTLVALSVTGFLVVFGQRFWNRPGGISASLSASSYDIYLAHMPLVIVLQYFLSGIPLSAFGKFAIVFLVATMVCWGASRFAKRRRKVWVPAGTLAAFGLCLLVWG